jgi:acyl-CoA reductase-like NAD-dependent aldehyde dehydrogenase
MLLENMSAVLPFMSEASKKAPAVMRRSTTSTCPSLLAFMSAVKPFVVLASKQLALCAVTFAEVLATSDVPGGVVNILTGNQTELLTQFAAHKDVNAIYHLI